MANNPKLPPPPSQNGVITAPNKGVVGGNRKKQKRRAKQAAKAAAQNSATSPVGHNNEYDEDPLGYAEEEEYEYSDADNYADQYASPTHNGANGYTSASKNHKKKTKAGQLRHGSAYNPELVANHVRRPPTPPPPPPPAMLRTNAKSGHSDIWNTSTQQERQNIKDFWLSLTEDERKSLLRIEKEAVLRKMKQQQKHSCSCTVCGRKRTAIEEELEVLYDGYYKELEQYAHHDHPPNLSAESMMPDPLHHRTQPYPISAPLPPNPHHKLSHLHEHLDDDDEEEEEYSEDEEYSDEEEYSDDALSSPVHSRGAVPDFFTFGQNLTVKDNILTVADDLLKNDGRKFIEMMEQLAERRMQRESEAEYAAANPSHPGGYPPGDPGYNHEDPLAAGEEYDDEEGSYDSQEEYDDELDDDDEMGGLTEEQRMQEGRRMFQIFAARMFEQRVLTAYKEKVAAERQQKLLEELEDETKLEAQREAKKQRDAQKKKDKKKQQQAAKAEEKARKEAEKAAEEARLREEEERKQEEQRRKREEQRKKKEDEKRKQEEERARKELERTRRQQEEQQRREEAERRAREAKAIEKAKREEARKREREEREAREKEARDRKAREEQAKKQREAEAHVGRRAREREKTTQQAPTAQQQQHQQQQQQPPAQISKKSSQAGMVAVPGAPTRHSTSVATAATGLSSQPAITTPAVPKAPTPAATRKQHASQQSSHASSPKQSQSQVSSAPSKSSSPGTGHIAQGQTVQPAVAASKVTQKAGNQPATQQPLPTSFPHANTALGQTPIQPPPGMQHQPQLQAAFGAGPPLGFQSFPTHQAPSLHGNVGARSPIPIYHPQAGGPMVVPSRFVPPGINGPPAMLAQPGRMGYPFDASGPPSLPPGFAQPQPNQSSPINPQTASPAPGLETQRSAPGMHSHSRQTSSSEKDRFDSAVNQPIARPTPIARPSSVKPHGDSGADVDDLSKHLGSSALLDDTDEPIPPGLADNRRPSNLAPGPRHAPSMTPLGSFGPPGGFGAPQHSWNPPGLGLGQTPSLGQQSWSNLSTPNIGAWPSGGSTFPPNGAFGTIGPSQIHRPSGAGMNRPLVIRLAVCQACKQLTSIARDNNTDGFHDVNLLLRQIEANRVPLDVPPTLREIEEICETEGDVQNGGGELHIRRLSGQHGAGAFAVMWQPLAGTPDQPRGIGEIGSPLPNKSALAGFGAPGLGRAPGSFASLSAGIGSSSMTTGNTGF